MIVKHGAIFDLDGTILDSMDYRIKSWNKAFKDFGIESDPEIIKLMIGYPGSMLIKAMHARDPDIEKREEKYFSTYFNDLKFFDDVDETFKFLKEHGFKIAVVTSSRREMLNKFKLNVDVTVTMDDVIHGKPDTEPYLKAIKLMGVEPQNTVVIGDIDNDLIPSRALDCLSVDGSMPAAGILPCPVNVGLLLQGVLPHFP